VWKQALQTPELQPSVLSVHSWGLFSQLAVPVVVAVVVVVAAAVVVSAVVAAVVAVAFVVAAATNRMAYLTKCKYFKHSLLPYIT
jgi:Flp pilus assembly protein TadB